MKNYQLINIGPVFCRPAEKYPSVFGGVQFFKDYPYALATFTTGAIGAIACIVSALFVKEVSNIAPHLLYATMGNEN
jgi:hypothetical protein